MKSILNLFDSLSQDYAFQKDIRAFLVNNPDAGFISEKLLEFINARDTEKPKESALIRFLRDHRDDRGVMADLRGAIIESKRLKAVPWLARFGGIENKAVQTIAACYALHPQETGKGNFGATCLALVDDEERHKLHETGEPGRLTKRFMHLLEAEGEEVFDRVTKFVLRAKASDVPVNYEQLFSDLKYWTVDPVRIRERWAKSYWTPKMGGEA